MNDLRIHENAFKIMILQDLITLFKSWPTCFQNQVFSNQHTV